MTFRVGQKVVCVDASGSYASGDPCPLVKGNIYTVTEIVDKPWMRNGPSIGVDAINAMRFSARRFRPVVERKTDISIFKKMLTPKTENADA